MGEGLGMKRFAVFGLVAALAACSGGKDADPTQLQLLNAARESAGRLVAGGQAAAARPALTRALLEQVDNAVLEVAVERRDISAFLFRVLERGDSDPGRIETWTTEDQKVTITTRNGMLIATRGLGGDLLSSAVQTEADRPGPAGGGAHVQMIRDLDNRERAVALSCELVDLGPETLDIVEWRLATRHLQQRCQGAGGRIENDYWVDPRAGVVWKSRQWAGPHLGYLRLRRLTK